MYNLSAQDSAPTRVYFDVPLLDFGYQSLAMRTAANHRNSLGAGAHAAVSFGDFFGVSPRGAHHGGRPQLLVAGGEGEVLLTRNLQFDNFYYGSGVPVTLHDLLITYTAKSDGWVAGSPFLTRSVSAGVGLSMTLER